LWESFFGFSKMDKNKCPKSERANILSQKAALCDHN